MGENIEAVDDRLDILTHSLNHDVIPGLERELNKVSKCRGEVVRWELPEGRSSV